MLVAVGVSALALGLLPRFADAASAGLSFQPVLGMPIAKPTLIGASAAGAPGEAWAIGGLGSLPVAVEGHSFANTNVLLRYTNQSGDWQVVPVLDAQGDAPEFNWGSGQVTPAGGVVLDGTAGSALGGGESILTDGPGGAFAAATVPSASGPQAVLQAGETLFPTSGAPLVAGLDESEGHTGALIAPVWVEGGSLEPGVLHYDGSSWKREPLCAAYEGGVCTPLGSTPKPLAIAASSPGAAWLLAQVGGAAELFQRVAVPGGAPLWVRVDFAAGLLSPEGPPAGERVSPAAGGPIITATNQGVWIDLTINGGPGQSASATMLVAASSPGNVLGTWCYPTQLCPAGTPSLGAVFPGEYSSFAWAGTAADESGARIISGLPDGALLRLGGSGQPTQLSSPFSYLPGGSAGVGDVAGAGAAFDSPQEGWIGGTSPLIHVTANPSPTQLTSWPAPFRSPLLAIVAQPGTVPGSPSAQALAVGAGGEIGRYLPGEGWTAEFLYNSNGERQTPNLRGVAWPEPERAYAVGDNGAMWLWQASTGAWEADPAAPIGFRGQLTGIAFSAVEPGLGYAVGKQGVLLAYDKSWTQQQPPPGLENANFTSVAFAGTEAIATYRMLNSSAHEVGGLIVNDGSGWRVDESAQALIGQLSPVLSKVAGLPDGGAVAAGPGIAIERDSSTSPWRFSNAPLPEAANISALAAFREGSSVRALASIDTGGESDPGDSLVYELIDNPAGPAFGPYGQLLGPDPLPTRGFLLRERAGGWQDLQDEDWPATILGEGPADFPGWPDAVLALLTDQDGDQGWAVGGQTGADLALYGLAGTQTAIQTAGVMRFGGGAAPQQATNAPIATPAGQASFAVAGDAQCATACTDSVNERIGPDAWLSGALGRASQIAGLQAFLYTGSPGGSDALAQVLPQYGGALPVYAPSAFGASSAPASATPYYSFVSSSAGVTPVTVIVLDYSAGAPNATQLEWLGSELEEAKRRVQPAIVLGSERPDAAVASLLVHGPPSCAPATCGASVYLFDSPEENVSATIGTGSEAIPEYGSGTLGYVIPSLHDPEEFFGASGFLVLSLDVAHRSALTNKARVSASLIPNVGQLGLEAADGTQLHRSQVGLFEGLARRPAGGEEKLTTLGNLTEEAPDPYTPIPESCIGSGCSQFIPPAYSFTSSNPDIGDFVESDPNSTNARAVLLGANGQPLPDPASGLFCAFNAGTTTVTISAGGLSYSEQVTVEAGSVERPCGTRPLRNPPAAEAETVPPPPAPAPPAPAPLSSPGPTALAPPPLPQPVAHPTHPNPHPALAPAPLLVLALPSPAPFPLRAALPPPAPQPARPTPPSGTSQVTQPVGVAEDERQQQQAVDVVHNMSAYDPRKVSLPPWSPVALIVIAAAAGSALRRPGRSRKPAWVRVDNDGT
jgi:hypothetical protein